MDFPSIDNKWWGWSSIGLLIAAIYKIIMGRIAENKDNHDRLEKEFNVHKNDIILTYVGKPTLNETKEEFRRDLSQVRAENHANHAETKATLAAQNSMMNELRASITASIVNAVDQLERGVERRHVQNNAQVEALRKDIIDLWKDRGQ